jgi:hypothetical protein
MEKGSRVMRSSVLLVGSKGCHEDLGQGFATVLLHPSWWARGAMKVWQALLHCVSSHALSISL